MICMRLNFLVTNYDNQEFFFMFIIYLPLIASLRVIGEQPFRKSERNKLIKKQP